MHFEACLAKEVLNVTTDNREKMLRVRPRIYNKQIKDFL